MPNSELMKPIHVDQLEWMSWNEGSRFASRGRILSSSQEGAKIGVTVEELEPGKQSCPAHYHIHEEEHVYVLSGEATLCLGEEKHILRPGMFASFPAGQRVGHCLINESNETFTYMMIGDHCPDEICVYTDSNKVMVRSLGEIYDKSATRNYWDGEETEK